MTLKAITLFVIIVIYCDVAMQDVFECGIKESSSNYPLIRLPRIDLLKYTEGTVQDRQEIVLSFKQYLHEYGTISLYNHQIPTEILNNMSDAGYNFHRRTEDYKTQFASNGVGSPGFDKLQSFAASASYGNENNTDGDYTEMFAHFNHKFGTNDYDTYHPIKENSPNELYDISRAYIPHIRRILKIVHNIASEALLGFNNTDFFENAFATTPHLQLRSFYYPAMNNNEELERLIKLNKFGISEHNDFLGFTLFRPGTQRGLQNQIGGKPNGVWMDCQTDKELEHDIFVNTGELFNIWTNDYWKANWHRVILQNDERVTFSYFTGPDQQLMIKPIEGCDVCTKDEPKYIERTAAQHAQIRFSGGDLNNPNGQKFYSQHSQNGINIIRS